MVHRGYVCIARPLAGLCVLLGACASHAGPPTHDAGPSFIAADGDFEGFTAWESFDGGTEPADSLPGIAQRTLYLNHRPPHGATEYPLGTIIVKTTDGQQTFAMAKRGGGFNSDGALNWEWFELATATTGSVEIVWRGPAAPASVPYGRPGSVTCNQCHFDDAFYKDFVAGTAVELSSF